VMFLMLDESEKMIKYEKESCEKERKASISYLSCPSPK